MGYKVKGRILEACSCNTLCPCWIGDDPDLGHCDAVLAYHYDEGQFKGIDVAGLTVALISHIPGNVLAGNWQTAVHVDSRATPEQKEAILAAHTGQLGGPLADLAPLIGQVLGVYDSPIDFNMVEGKGTFRVGEVASAEMEPATDAQGRPTKLVDTVFSTIPGSPAYVGRATSMKVNQPEHELVWEFSGRNATLGDFLFEG